ncbi:MAG: ribosomal-processing cysteine protease Prp [Bacillota bacterium]|nr:ribosomal-processing cysteine protease Prp [Bacillota bacterium]
MIRVEVHRRAGRVTGFRVRGHAGLAPRGHDIVCAAVSALTQAAVAGLEEHLGLRPTVRIEAGRLDCQLAPGEEEDPRAQAILATMVLGLQGVAAGQRGRLQISEIDFEPECGQGSGHGSQPGSHGRFRVR